MGSTPLKTPPTPRSPGRRHGAGWAKQIGWRAGLAAAGLAVLAAFLLAPWPALPIFALLCGLLFFLYGLRYYTSVAIIMLSTTGGGNGNGNGTNGRGNGNGLLNGLRKWTSNHVMGGRNGEAVRLPPEKQPFVSIQLPMYNEDRVVDRLLTACTNLDYANYEVLVADDSSDQTLSRVEAWAKHPRVRVSHRINRSGFKGAALKHATEVMDRRAEFVVVFDADFIPPPDILHQFLSYFYGINGANGNGRNGEELSLVDDRLAVVQGYQWHVLNASENWITTGIRTEFAGSYVIERSWQELTGGMKMIAGSVFMIRADVLRQHTWGTSITEDWELTLRLYLDGYKILYTPYIQAPAECVSDFKQLAKQRMRWAEGHTHNVRRYFSRVLRSPQLSRREKLEFLYYAPYYLTSVLFLLGTLAWMISELLLKVRLPFWTDVLGWSLVFTNAFALVLMNLAGLFQERGVQRSWLGLFSFTLLTFLLVPYQAYAAIKGLLEPHEGDWHRTQKSGVVTEVIRRMGLGRHMPKLLPKKKQHGVDIGKRLGLPTARLWRQLPLPAKNAILRMGRRLGPASGIALGGLIVFMLLSAMAGVSPAIGESRNALYFHNTPSPMGYSMSLATPAGSPGTASESTSYLSQQWASAWQLAAGNSAIHLWIATGEARGEQILKVTLAAGSDTSSWTRLGATSWAVDTGGEQQLLEATFYTEAYELQPGERLRLDVSLPESGDTAILWDGPYAMTRFEMPTNRVPLWSVTLLPAGPLVLYLGSWLRRRRKITLRLMSFFLATSVTLGLLAFHVPSAGAMPSYDVGTGTTFWLYDDTTPLQYMMYQSQPTGVSTNAGNTTVNFYSDTWPAGWQLNAGTSTVYFFVQTIGNKSITFNLYAGTTGSWTLLGTGTWTGNPPTITLVSTSFSTNAYTFSSSGLRLRLEAQIQNNAWMYWDGSYNNTRLETPAIVVPEGALALVLPGMLIPVLAARLRRRRSALAPVARTWKDGRKP